VINYYHLGLEEAQNLSIRDFNYLYECMVKATATERIKNLDLYTFAYSDNKRQRDVVKNLYSEATPDEEKKERVVTIADLKRFGFDALAGKAK
jgi:hypothetical protein